MKNQGLFILIIGLGILVTGVVCVPPQNRKVTLLTYYSDFIDVVMGFIEDISIDFIVPTYNYIKSHTALKYLFFTFLIILCVFNVLGNFNHIFKANKKVRFVANQDIPKDSKDLQKQIRRLRETVSLLKQQTLNQPAGTPQPNTSSHQQVNNPATQGIATPVTLDPAIEQRIIKNQQNIDILKSSIMKIVEIQQDLQKSIIESQREVVQDIHSIRTNKPFKKSSGLPYSSQLDTSQQRGQNSTSFLEETNNDKKNQFKQEQNFQQQDKQIVEEQPITNLNQYEDQVQPQINQQVPPSSFNPQGQQPPPFMPPVQQPPSFVPPAQQQQTFMPPTQQNPPPFVPQGQQNLQQQNQQVLQTPAFVPQTQQTPTLSNRSSQSPSKMQPIDQTAERKPSSEQPPSNNTDSTTGGQAFGRPPPSRPTPFGGRQPPSLMNKKQPPVRAVPQGNVPMVIPPK